MGRFQNLFTRANQDLRESGVTSRSAGCQANNASTPTITAEDTSQEAQALEAIANLATASADSRQTINALTQTNASLVAELVSLRKEAAALKLRKTKNHCCWSYGTLSDYKSKNCANKKPGNKDDATFYSKQGGSETKCVKT